MVLDVYATERNCPLNSQSHQCGRACEPTCENQLEKFCKLDPTVSIIIIDRE